MLQPRSFQSRSRLFVLAGVLAAAGALQAKVVEETIRVPVSVEDAYGKKVEQDVVVTVFVDDTTPLPRPVLVLNHGRAAEAEERARLGQARYSANSRWLAQLGFLVAVPTRVGYGASGGDDVEDSGSCDRKNYAPGYLASTRETLAVLGALRRRPDASADRGVVIGQSYGGTTSIAVASLNPPGIQATVNFAGGGGGNPKTRPQNPCGTPSLERLFGNYGKTARIPTLWIYTENDQYFGPRYPRAWFDAFAANGGIGEFVQYPPHGDDGHSLFTHGPEVWRPRLLEFFRAHGIAVVAPEAAAER